MYNCQAVGDPVPTIRWTKVGSAQTPTEQLKNGSLLLRNIQKSDEGQYTCSATNIVKTAAAKITISVYSKFICYNWGNQSTSQSVSQSDSHPVTQSISQTVGRLVSRSINTGDVLICMHENVCLVLRWIYKFFIFAFQLPVELILNPVRFTDQIASSLLLEKRSSWIVSQVLRKNKMEIFLARQMGIGTNAFLNVTVWNRVNQFYANRRQGICYNWEKLSGIAMECIQVFGLTVVRHIFP